MSTIHNTRLQSNPNVQLLNDGGQLTNDAGLVLFLDFLHRSHFSQALKETVHFTDQRTFHRVDYSAMLQEKILLNVVGYLHDSAANEFRRDPELQAILGPTKLVSQASLSRFFANITSANLTELRQLLWRIAVQTFQYTHQKQFLLDVDSTHADTYGYQESAAYNAHYMAYGYHPQVLFEQQTGILLDAFERPGNDYTGKDADQFVIQTLDRLHDLTDQANVIIRGDSGFAAPQFYDACDDRDVYFIVRLKANQRLGRLAEAAVNDTELTSEDNLTLVNEIDYQAATWTRAYRVIVRSQHVAGELPYWTHTFIVTNLINADASILFPAYQARDRVENDIKELKRGFGFDKTDSSSFICNTARALISGVAYNLMQLFKQVLMPTDNRITINTLRFKLFHIAGKVVRHAHQIQIRLASNHVYQNWFWQLMEKIQQLQI